MDEASSYTSMADSMDLSISGMTCVARTPRFNVIPRSRTRHNSKRLWKMQIMTLFERDGQAPGELTRRCAH
jgi:hypothetical protein